MKFCPTCQTRYDEEILRFCTKDGSPLIEESRPEFTDLPSETEDDLGSETVIRRKSESPDAGEHSATKRPGEGQRIVIPTSEADRQIRPRNQPPIRSTPPAQFKSNTAMVVVATVVGTLVVLAGAVGVFYLLSGQTLEDANQNVNANFNSVNPNLNANIDNINFDFNSNANMGTNINGLNLNINTNLKTPTPTPTPTPSPTPTPTATPTPAANANIGNVNKPTVSPSPLRTPDARPTTPREPTPPPNGQVKSGVNSGRRAVVSGR